MADITESPHRTWLKRLLATCVWAVMAAVFAITGWLYGIRPIAVAVGNWQVARDYQAVPATVIQRSAKAADGTDVSWVSAQYEVSGKTYFAERLTVLDNDAIDEPSNAEVLTALDLQRKGETTTVWVSPRKPEIALVSRDLPLRSLWTFLPLAIGFALLALAGVTGAIGALFNPGYYRKQMDAAGLWGFAAIWCGFIFPVLLLLGADKSSPFFAYIIVGLFALIGVFLIWGAISATLYGTNPNAVQITAGSRRSRLPDSALATTGGKKGKKAEGDVKRGGMGGRGDGFDKN